MSMGTATNRSSSYTARANTRRNDYGQGNMRQGAIQAAHASTLKVDMAKSCKTIVAEARANLKSRKAKNKGSILNEAKAVDSILLHQKCNRSAPFFWKVKRENKSHDELEIRASKGSNWVSMIDTITNRKYYFNVVTRESQWENPSGYCYKEMLEHRDKMKRRDQMSAEEVLKRTLQSTENSSTQFSPPQRLAQRSPNKPIQGLMESQVSNHKAKNEATKMLPRHKCAQNEQPRKTICSSAKIFSTIPSTFQDTENLSTDSSWLVSKLLAKPTINERTLDLTTNDRQNKVPCSNSKKRSIPSRCIGTQASSPEPSWVITTRKWSEKQSIAEKTLKAIQIRNEKSKTMKDFGVEKPSDSPSISGDPIVSSPDSSLLVTKFFEKPDISRIKTPSSAWFETHRTGKILNGKTCGSYRGNAIENKACRKVIHTHEETANALSTPSTCEDTTSTASPSTSSLSTPYPKFMRGKLSNSNYTTLKKICTAHSPKHFFTTVIPKSKYQRKSINEEKSYDNERDEERWCSSIRAAPPGILQSHSFQKLQNTSHKVKSSGIQESRTEIWASQYGSAIPKVEPFTRPHPKDLLRKFDSCCKDDTNVTQFSAC